LYPNGKRLRRKQHYGVKIKKKNTCFFCILRRVTSHVTAPLNASSRRSRLVSSSRVVRQSAPSASSTARQGRGSHGDYYVRDRLTISVPYPMVFFSSLLLFRTPWRVYMSTASRCIIPSSSTAVVVLIIIIIIVIITKKIIGIIIIDCETYTSYYMYSTHKYASTYVVNYVTRLRRPL
jgi:hypothetical protein